MGNTKLWATALTMFQIAEEGYYNGEGAGVRSARVQFAEYVDKVLAVSDVTTRPAVDKDDMLLQPLTTDDGYLTPTTRATTADDDGNSVPQSYLSLLDSPTDTAAPRKLSSLLSMEHSCHDTSNDSNNRLSNTAAI